METGAARITVARQLPHDVKVRQIIVSLDGNRFATLLYGGSATREIEPGHHSIRAYNTLVWKTREFDVKPGEHVQFDVANRAGWGTFWMVALLGAGPIFLDFERT